MFNKPLIIALFVSISLNCLFGYLSYSFYSDKAVAESQLETAVKANKDLKESLDKKETACKITDVIVSEYTKEKQEIVKETDGVLNAIDKLPSKSVQAESKPKRQENVKEQIDVASLDDKLPADLVRLLSESCITARGSACDYP
ncbi:inner membrane subunit [Pseudomonas phage vB_PsaM_M1]|nr:inner membrane subunit [Pseudomonas phage vB_PsaM_M1]